MLEDNDNVVGTSTSQLRLLNIQAGSSGGYRCVVGNTAAEVESEPVVLTIPSDGKAMYRLTYER